MNIRLKACAHCGGDVFIERDMDGQWLVCLQCGRSSALPSTPTEKRAPQSAGVA